MAFALAEKLPFLVVTKFSLVRNFQAWRKHCWHILHLTFTLSFSSAASKGFLSKDREDKISIKDWVSKQRIRNCKQKSKSTFFYKLAVLSSPKPSKLLLISLSIILFGQKIALCAYKRWSLANEWLRDTIVKSDSEHIYLPLRDAVKNYLADFFR